MTNYICPHLADRIEVHQADDQAEVDPHATFTFERLDTAPQLPVHGSTPGTQLDPAEP